MWFYKSGESGQWENTEKPTRTLFLRQTHLGLGPDSAPTTWAIWDSFLLDLSFIICIMGKTRMPNLRGKRIIQCLYTAEPNICLVIGTQMKVS